VLGRGARPAGRETLLQWTPGVATDSRSCNLGGPRHAEGLAAAPCCANPGLTNAVGLVALYLIAALMLAGCLAQLRYTHAVPCALTWCPVHSRGAPCALTWCPVHSRGALCTHAVPCALTRCPVHSRGAPCALTRCPLCTHVVPCALTRCPVHSRGALCTHAVPCALTRCPVHSRGALCTHVVPSVHSRGALCALTRCPVHSRGALGVGASLRAGVYCNNCQCVACLNLPVYKDKVVEKRQSIMRRDPEVCVCVYPAGQSKPQVFHLSVTCQTIWPNMPKHGQMPLFNPYVK